MFSAAGKSAVTSGYNINNSLRFRASASAYLNRTPASAGNQQKFTWSGWVKIGYFSVGYLQAADGNSGNRMTSWYMRGVGGSGSLEFEHFDGTTTYNLTSSAVFRDPSAWYHIVIAVDTTQATNTDRVKIYVNSTQQTVTGTYVPQNTSLYVNGTTIQAIGSRKNINAGYGNYLDGYLAEVNFIDGSALTPSSFGETDGTTGVWKPKKYGGSFGTNGFYLPFSDIATTSGSNAGLGKDSSGNGNYWTTNNISVTSGITYDAMIDSPTNTSATVANYAVLNPVSKSFSQPTFSNANLTVASNAASYQNAFSSIGTGTTGKYYCEILFAGSASSALFCGISNSSEINYFTTTADVIGATANGYSIALLNGNKYTNGVSSSYGSSFSNGDIIQIAYDADNGKLWFGKNGTYFASGNPASGTNEAFSGITGTYFIGVTAYQHPTLGTSTYNANFGQRPFSYTPPTGYVALNTFNLPTSTIVKGSSYMDATTYTGTGSALSITNVGSFKPDLVWIKSRSAAGSYHGLTDSVRGRAYPLFSNATDAEGTSASDKDLTSFNSNGFSLGVGNQYNNNTNGSTYVAWQWQAGQGTSTVNTSGSISSNVSVNTTAGFSVVTYTGNGTAGATVGHGLGVSPSMVIIKNRGATYNWVARHSSLSSTQNVSLNTTDAAYTVSSGTANGGVGTLTSTTFGFISGTTGLLSSNANTNTYVAYCWAEIAGFSKFGSYTGNGSTDGPFIYLGFRPKFVLVKGSTYASNWNTFDASRNTYNITTQILRSNLTDAEFDGNATTGGAIDITSNGFKIRKLDGDVNSSGQTLIYAAFAENPFKNALAR